MQGVIQVGNAGVVAIHSQQILGEVIAAYRHEIYPSGKCPGLEHRCRHLDHDPDRGQLTHQALLQYLPVTAVYQVQRLVQFGRIADHRQHYAQISQAFIGLEHGANLGQEYLRMVEGDPDTAPAQKGVVFLYRKIGQ